MNPPPLCVIAVPLCDPDGKRHHTWFSVFENPDDSLFGGSELCTSRDPLVDAAKYYLREGLDPRTPIVLRHDFDGPVVRQSTLSEAARGALFGGNVVNLAKFRALKALRTNFNF